MAKKPKFKRYNERQIWFYSKRAFWILFAWVLISNVLFFYEFFTLKSNGGLTSAFDFESSFTANMIVAVLAGLIGGIFTVNLMERWLRKHAFWKALLYITIAYITTAILISFIGMLYFKSDALGLPFYDPEVLQAVGYFFTTWLFLKNFILWLLIVIVTLIVLMVNDKYGPGVFPDYLMGRYFMPKNERRIFMFADIKDATTIAEELGEEKYFNFLKDFFRDIAPAIVQTRAEVYQYVGDEVVLSWKMKHGLKHGNALQCFYSMKRLIAYKSPKYIKKYGVAPVFKAGYHYGNVMVGEIGQIKRDIAFSGDVLNTTSRIQSLCNELGVEILASKEFGDLSYKLPKRVVKHPVGKEKLKGKAEEMELVTYTRNQA
ncbi:adenylate/guanylate cyclase domain-containing protein [Cochleicola gelatinilyticus]|uniref:Guanylate cyclase domain-containing protein n=1 Tax=Cochleicola gelatinilyticus TaxID=1763537 RepID=A0A167HQP6_9FLAO|nr:adenylate/guanylate cyclase domain-containing protein [Cochleicola gelatinilyticus]OAB78864.1 hypothetical protein ULVI_09795 [Cochleicola gelatinilyticus]